MICPDCKRIVLRLFPYVGRSVCRRCKEEAQVIEFQHDDERLDDPRHGQAASINAMRREVK